MNRPNYIPDYIPQDNVLNNGWYVATPDKVSINELIEADITQSEFLREYLPKYLPSIRGQR